MSNRIYYALEIFVWHFSIWYSCCSGNLPPTSNRHWVIDKTVIDNCQLSMCLLFISYFTASILCVIFAEHKINAIVNFVEV